MTGEAIFFIYLHIRLADSAPAGADEVYSASAAVRFPRMGPGRRGVCAPVDSVMFILLYCVMP